MPKSPKNILFIGSEENQPVNVIEVCRSLQSEKVKVDFAAPQKNLLEILLETKHDIIILDIEPYGKKVFGILQKLFKIDPRKGILLLADKKYAEFYAKAMRCGVYDFLRKESLTSPLLERAVSYAFSHKKTLDKLHESESKYKNLIENLPAMFYISEVTSPYSQIYVSPSFAKFGYDLNEWLNIKNMWQTVIHPDDKERILQETKQAMAKGKITDYEYRIIGKNGKIFWVQDSGHFYHSTENRTVYWQGIMTDITERKIAQEQLIKKLNFDDLTGLRNRQNFVETLEKSLKKFSKNPEKKFAVFLLDMDRFKLINDSMGHLTGDKFLIQVSRKLESVIGNKGVAARLSGDEFSVLIYDASNPEEIERIALAMCQILSEPVELEGYKFSSSASIGIAVSDPSWTSGSTALRNADVAMYSAKISGKNCYKYFDREMHVSNLRQVGLENEMRSALELGEFSLNYQPIISLKTGEICQIETLLRWNNKNYGSVTPAEFIPIAEETGLIDSIGKWVLEQACRQLKQWQKTFPSKDDLVISVNISAKQIIKEKFADELEAVLKKFELSPKNLRLEITESTLLESGEYVSKTINAISSLGVSISTDDFGTGYSSLSYLHRFPFEELKIDSFFVGNLDKDRKSSKIVRTMINLARSLDLRTVAEGVETKEQMQQLIELGCDFGQGFFFAKPLSAQMVENLLEKGIKEFPSENEMNLAMFAEDLPPLSSEMTN